MSGIVNSIIIIIQFEMTCCHKPMIGEHTGCFPRPDSSTRPHRIWAGNIRREEKSGGKISGGENMRDMRGHPLVPIAAEEEILGERNIWRRKYSDGGNVRGSKYEEISKCPPSEEELLWEKMWGEGMEGIIRRAKSEEGGIWKWSGIIMREVEILGKKICGNISGAIKTYLCCNWVSLQSGSVTFAPAEWGILWDGLNKIFQREFSKETYTQHYPPKIINIG